MIELPLFPLNTVLFPTMPLALHIFEERYKQMVARCLESDLPFGVVLIREGSEVGAPAVPFEVGTTAQIVGVDQLLQGRLNLVCVGRKRFRLLGLDHSLPYLVARVEFVPHRIGERAGLADSVETVRQLFSEYISTMATIVDTQINADALPDNAWTLAYTVAAALQVSNAVKQQWLMADSIEEILADQAELLPKELARLKLLAQVEQERKGEDDQQMGSFSKN
jgi:Lon protease-like protein